MKKNIDHTTKIKYAAPGLIRLSMLSSHGEDCIPSGSIASDTCKTYGGSTHSCDGGGEAH